MPLTASTWLQQRSCQLEGQSNQAHLGKAQAVVGLEQGIDRREYGLDQVVDQMCQRAGADYFHDKRACLPGY